MKILTHISIIVFLVHCASSPANSSKIPQDSHWQEIADFLSGMPSAETGKFAELTKKNSYKEYSKNLDNYWNKIQKDYLQKVVPFKEQHVDSKFKSNLAFYPFSGADFINLNAFYPDANNYLMIGLEPIGNISDPLKLNEDQLRLGLRSMQNAVYEMAALNYFTRKRMRIEFSNPYFSGTTPILIFFMTRLGYKIQYVEKTELNESGELVPIPLEQKVEATKPVAVKIYFSKDTRHGTLTFLKIFLEKNSHEIDTPAGKFFQKLGRRNLLLKSAEYELQVPTYDNWIQSILSKTDMVVQDDSGLHFRNFTGPEWTSQVFGVYTGRFRLQGVPPVSDQIELIEPFKQRAKILPFKYGYGALRGEGKSNLMIISRK